MSSATRKMVRDMRRKMALKGITDDKLEAITDAVKQTKQQKLELVEQSTRKELQAWQKTQVPKIEAATRGDVLVRLMAYMRDEFHFGKGRLDKFMIGFMRYMNDIKLNQITNTQIIEAIKDETGFDMRDGLKTAQDETYKDSRLFEKMEKRFKREGK